MIIIDHELEAPNQAAKISHQKEEDALVEKADRNLHHQGDIKRSWLN
jgi:hypothetical protein